MAVALGYKNVYRDPYGYPEWQGRGMPIASAPAGLAQTSEESKAPGPLYGWAMIWTLLGIFAGGMALNLTPCVYPLIPITVSYFGGQAAKGREGRGKLVAHGLCYMFGLAITNSVLGVVASLTGGLMGAMLQNPIVLIGVAAVLISFATSLFGLWEMRPPSGLTQAAAKSYTGYSGSLFMGLTLGVVAAPCIGPFVLGLLTWVASMGSPWLGFIIFFTLSLGLGLPLFLLAMFSGQLERLPRSGGWMIWVRSLMGWVLVGMAVHFISPVLPGHWGTVMLSLVALAAGLHLGWIDKNKGNFRMFPWLKGGVGVSCLVLATFLITSWAIQGPGVTWKPYTDNTMKEADQLKKPIIIDFYATWCTPCRELEEVTFHDASVVKQAESDFVMIKVDVTKGGNPLNERLLQEYGVKGVPTIVFLNSNGKERQKLRLVDYIPPDQFLGRMAEVKKNGG
ncbi:MAG: thioredoxin family protein [Deltaproteobacteria bacterium]|nr:thioredoxin family protein [Deltaproteobacteria bacterium]MBF0525652.1 thioredoxin family protein [Deltaproteobacteria bacterium]